MEANVNIPSITGEHEASKSFITTRLAAMPGQARQTPLLI